ncbi:MAG: sigma 54-interacting transcriptional regulator [Nitrospirae bacterium]|nr:sigma 54-interacting transcriptional regulator [Nitrospirota bacterium]MBF0592859.1 sigma 54-interacting transcriptional regulator [Nitrospirota bacterium]
MQPTVAELKRYASGLSVLYVEDDDTMRHETYHILTKFFTSVETAANGREGLQSYRQRQYDLVISDIRMPLMDGIKMTSEIKGINKEQSIIITSAYDESEYLVELINIGIDNFIIKPLNNKKFLETLLQACRNVTYEKQIQRYKTNTEAIFRSVGEVIITVDNDMKVIEANDAVRHICAIDKEAVIGKPFKSAFAACSMGCYDVLARTLKETAPAKINHVECHKKGKKRLVVGITTYPLLDAKGVAYGAVMVIKDDTYTSLLETEIGHRRQFYKLIGKSEAMQRVYSLIESLADLKTTVLITGESGVGKELVAEAIHYNGSRCAMPLVKVNCSALPEGLLESELFGHVKGAFTGAIKDRKGRFQIADGGTILLDEIGDISISIQLRLLRVLQDLEFERVGDATPIRTNTRIIASTNKDLKELVAKGEFREDLYYRLNVIEVHVPPLRQRRDDIHILVRYFIDRFNILLKKDITDVSSDVMKVFLTHPFSGNIRELQHAIEHAFVLCNKSVITVDDLPRDFIDTNSKKPAETLPPEYHRIIEALQQSHFRRAKAAQILGISRIALYTKMKKYNIKP